MKRDNELALHWTEMRMIRWMGGVKLRDKLSCIELRQQLRTENTAKWYKRTECNGTDTDKKG